MGLNKSLKKLIRDMKKNKDNSNCRSDNYNVRDEIRWD